MRWCDGFNCARICRPAVTVWGYRKKGKLTTVNICGRHYILRAEIARFNERAAVGKSAKDPIHPRKSILPQRA